MSGDAMKGDVGRFVGDLFTGGGVSAGIAKEDAEIRKLQEAQTKMGQEQELNQKRDEAATEARRRSLMSFYQTGKQGVLNGIATGRRRLLGN